MYRNFMLPAYYVGIIRLLYLILFSLYIFQARMKFPQDYPYSPPSIKFLTKVWHPNVYEVSNNSKEVNHDS